MRLTTLFLRYDCYEIYIVGTYPAEDIRERWSIPSNILRLKWSFPAEDIRLKKERK